MIGEKKRVVNKQLYYYQHNTQIIENEFTHFLNTNKNSAVFEFCLASVDTSVNKITNNYPCR